MNRLFVCSLFALAAANVFAADEPKEPISAPAVGHLETPRMAPAKAPRSPQFSPGTVVQSRDGYTSVQVNVNASGQNIVGDAANEPSIAVDPTNPYRMVIGWRQFDSISSDFRQAGYGYSHDGGRHWTFPGVIEPGVFRSDPVLDADAQGNFYYNSLTATTDLSDFWCHVYKSTDGGATWDNGTYAYGGDKQWMIIDKTNSVGQGNFYAYWTQWYSTCYPGHFTRSIDNGQSFQACTSPPSSPQWGTLAIGPDGELYIGAEGFLCLRSSNAKYDGQTVSWDLNRSVNLDGSIGYSGGPNPGGLLGQTWIDVDRSGGPNDGNVYMLCSVVRSSSPDPLDVMFARSTDGGSTWSSPIRVNDDASTSNYQWLATMSVAPNGRIDVIWLDTRANPGTYLSELYYAYSDDGGLTFSPNIALSPAFNPSLGYPQQNKMGDYFHMRSDDAGADLAYCGTFNGEQDVYYIRIGDRCEDAGVVEFDRAVYSCESTLTVSINDCGLNGDPNSIDIAQITITSTSEPGGETVTLTESAAASAFFTGSLDASMTDAAGVLWITDGDVITAEYIDADDGAGGSNVLVTATATAECTPPIIINVAAAPGARDATITFDTSEPAQGAVHYGLSCGSLIDATDGAGGVSAHSIVLTGLTPGQTYYYMVEATDLAGNLGVDPQCYSFTTSLVPEFFTEIFDSSANDLHNISITLTPAANISGYVACADPITELPTDPTGGVNLSLGDDSFASVSLTGGQTVELYGVSYSSFYVCANGNLTFLSGDGDYSESLEDHFSEPRISALFDDLNPNSGGTISYRQLADRMAVTYLNVPEYSATGANTFQFEMYFDGRIVLSYTNITATDGLAGVSAGNGVDPDFGPTDLSALGTCDVLLPGDVNCDGLINNGDIDPFVLAITDAPGYAAAYPDCDIMAADVNGDGLVNNGDIDPFVALLTGG